MLLVAGMLVTTGLGCGGDTKEKDKKKDGTTTKEKDTKTPPKDGG